MVIKAAIVVPQLDCRGCEYLKEVQVQVSVDGKEISSGGILQNCIIFDKRIVDYNPCEACRNCREVSQNSINWR